MTTIVLNSLRGSAADCELMCDTLVSYDGGAVFNATKAQPFMVEQNGCIISGHLVTSGKTFDSTRVLSALPELLSVRYARHHESGEDTDDRVGVFLTVKDFVCPPDLDFAEPVNGVLRVEVAQASARDGERVKCKILAVNALDLAALGAERKALHRALDLDGDEPLDGFNRLLEGSDTYLGLCGLGGGGVRGVTFQPEPGFYVAGSGGDAVLQRLAHLELDNPHCVNLSPEASAMELVKYAARRDPYTGRITCGVMED